MGEAGETRESHVHRPKMRTAAGIVLFGFSVGLASAGPSAQVETPFETLRREVSPTSLAGRSLPTAPDLPERLSDLKDTASAALAAIRGGGAGESQEVVFSAADPPAASVDGSLVSAAGEPANARARGRAQDERRTSRADDTWPAPQAPAAIGDVRSAVGAQLDSPAGETPLTSGAPAAVGVRETPGKGVGAARPVDEVDEVGEIDEVDDDTAVAPVRRQRPAEPPTPTRPEPTRDGTVTKPLPLPVSPPGGDDDRDRNSGLPAPDGP